MNMYVRDVLYIVEKQPAARHLRDIHIKLNAMATTTTKHSLHHSSSLQSKEVGGGDLTLLGDLADVVTAVLDLAGGVEGLVLGGEDVGEAPVLGADDNLAAGELHAGTAESLLGLGGERLLGAEGEEDLANADAGDGAVGLSVGLAHTGLETIGTSAGKHLVDTDDVEGVGTDAHVEDILVGLLDHVLVGLNTGGLESLGGDLLELAGDAVEGDGELVDASATAANVEVTDLGIRDTAVEAGLGEGLVLAEAVAASGTATHDFLT